MPLYVKNKNRKTAYTSLIAALAIGMLIGGWFSLRPVFAQSTNNSIKQISLSASLFNNESRIITNGTYEVRFGIYSTDRAIADPYPSNADAGSRLWEETQTVTVKNGIFRAFLGSVTPLPDTLNFESGDYYIGMRIGTDSEMVPRKKLGSVPRAVNAQFLQGRTIGTQSGNIPVLGNKGKIDIKNLPTGTGNKQLVLGNDSRFDDIHQQNTDTGTDAEIFNIGSGTALSGTNFDLTVSSSATPPALRFNGTTQAWQFSNDGATFTDISASSTVDFLASADGAGATSSFSGFELAGTSADELALLQGCTNGQALGWNDTTNVWECTSFSAGLAGTGTTGYATYWSGTSSLGSEAQLAVSRGGTGVNGSAAGNGTLLIGNGTGYSLAALTSGTGITVTNGAGSISIASTLGTSIDLTTEVTGTLPVGNGGTGAVTFTANGLLYGNTTGALQVTAAGTSAQFLVANVSGVPTFVTMSSDATISNAGVLTIAADAVALTTDTSGNYVATITAGSGISGSSSSEGGTPTIALGALTADWNQTGAFDISLNNASSELKILESAGGAFFGIFDVTDLSADRTYTFSDASGTVLLSGGTLLTLAGTSGSNQTISQGDTLTIAAGTGITTTGGATDTVTVAATLGTAVDGSEITDNTIEEVDLEATNAPTNTYILSYDSATGGFTWIDNTGGTGSSKFTDSGTITYLTSATDDLALGGSTATASKFFFDVNTGNQIIFEGTGADDLSETTLVITNPTADRTLTLPNLSGTVALLDGGQTFTSAVWNGTAIGPTFGGTGLTAYTTGDLIYASATDTLAARGIGSAGQVLTVSGGVPTWATIGGGGGGGITADSLDFIDFEDTLDLDAALILNQSTNTWTQNFTGLATTGLTYNAASLTTGSALNVTATNTATSNTALSAIQFNLTNAQSALGLANTNGVTGLAVNFTNNPSIAGNTEYAVRIQNQATANTTDNAVAALLLLDNADTTTSGTTIVTDAISITNSGGSNFTNFLNTPTLDISALGVITGATGITSSGTITFSGLSTAGIVTNTSGGVLGTTVSVPIANGGTNAATIGSAGSIPYSTGTAYAFSAVGTTGQALISGGTGAPTFFAPTAGSVVFAGTSGILQEDNTNFFWDDTNNRLGIGDATPDASLDFDQSSTSTTAATTYGANFTISDTGIVTTGTDTTYGTYTSVTRTGATGGTINTYGQYVSLTSDIAAAGTSTAYGNYISLAGAADTGYGVYITTAATPIIYGLYADVTQQSAGTAGAAVYGKLSTSGNGTNGTAYGGYFENAAANFIYDSSIKYGLYTTSTGTFTGGAGAATTNYALYIAAATGADTNYSLYSASSADSYFTGNVGIGDTTPAALFTVGDTDLFQVNSSGAIAAATGITSSGTITFSGLSTAGIVTNTSGGVLGTTATVPIANGGTNAATIGSAGSIPYSTGTAYAFSAVGTTGQALISGGTGAPTFYAPTAGSILFAGTSGILSQDNTNFFWDDTNNRLGIAYNTPAARLDIAGDTTTASLGSEMITATADRDFSGAGNWSGTNWTVGSGVATHTTGFNTFTLAAAGLDPDPVSGSMYQITFTTNTTTAGTITPSIGGVSGIAVGQATGTSFQTQVITATGTGALTFTPSGLWAGTLDDISVKLITPSNATQIVRNSDNTIGLEIRAGGTGLNNSFIGVGAGKSTTTGSPNSFFGNGAGLSNTTGYNNAFIGIDAGKSNTTGFYNTFIGYSAGYSNTASAYNASLGTYDGSYNSFLGTYAGNANTTGSSNTFIGASAGQSTTTGYFNTFIGDQAGSSNTTGAFNSSLGRLAGGFNTTGSYNLYLGYSTDGSAATASSIGLGYNTTVTASNQLVIGSSDTNGSITDAYFGQGVTKASPAGIVFNATGGSGTNNAGAPLTIAAGKGTGNASGGSLIFQTSDAGASGATLQSLTTKATLLASGNFGIGDTTPASLLTVGNGDLFNVNTLGDVTSTFSALNGSTTANGAGTASTTLILTSATNFDVGNYVLVNGTYAKITNIATNTLTISPALTWANLDAVTEYHIPEIGATNIASTLTNRYGRGYFIDGIVTGNASTYYTDSAITQTTSTTFNLLNTGTTTLNIGGAATTLSIGADTGTTTVNNTLSVPDGISTAGTITFSGLSTAGIVTNTSGGVLGTTATVPIANGGTNAATIGSAGSIPYSTGTAYAFSAVGTTGQALISGGTGAPTFFAPTLGSILFAGTSGILAQDNTNFFWDDTNNRLGIAYNTPAARLDIAGDTTTASQGSEQITATADRDFSSSIGNWTGTNWTVGSGVATHTAGANAFTLAAAGLDPDPVSGSIYQVTFTTNTTTAGTITPSIGGVSGIAVGQATGTNTQTQVITATATTALTFTPDAAWAGTLDNISVKLITPSNATQIVRNSDNTIGLEIRAGGTGLSNTFIGTDAGKSNSTGSTNTFVGYQAGYSHTISSRNTFLGYQAGYSHTTGSLNTFLGYQAGVDNTTGSNNTFVSYLAGSNNTTGSENAFLGRSAGSNNTTGSSNIFIGYLAGFSNTTGNYNLYFGYSTDGSAATASSIGLGYNTTVTASNQLVIGSDDTNGSITDAYFGQGVTKVSPAGIVFNATGGSGTNNAGAPLTIAAGKATGNAVGGSLIFQTSDAGSTGTTLQSLTTKATLLASGNFGIGDTTPDGLLDLDSSATTTNVFGITNTGIFTGTGTSSIAQITANSATTGSILTLSGTGLTTGYAQNINVDSATTLTTGGGLKITGPTGAATMDATTGLLNITATGAITNTSGGAGSGVLFQVTADGAITPSIASISSTAVMTTTGKLLNLVANSATTTTGLFKINATGLTTGYAMDVDVDGAAVLTTGGAINIDGPTGAAAQAAGSLLKITTTGAVTGTAGSGNSLQITSGTLTGTVASITDAGVMTTTGNLLTLTANAATNTSGLITQNATGLTTGYAMLINVNGSNTLTSGGGIKITGPTGAAAMTLGAGNSPSGLVNISTSGAVTTDAGRGSLLQLTGTGTITGTLASITNTSAMTTTGNLLTLTANSATTAAGLQIITANGLTSGKALSIASSATAFTGSLQEITLSGSNAANTGSLLTLSDTGALNTTTPFKVTAAGAATQVAALIENTGSGTSFRVNDVASDTTPFVIDADGNVGINYSTPGAKLDIAGTAGPSGSGSSLRVTSSTVSSIIASITGLGVMTTTSNLLTLTADSATTSTGLLTMSGNGLTSGSAISVASSSTAFTGSLQNITLSGSNAANTGNLLLIADTGALNTTTPFKVTAAGAATQVVALIENTGTGTSLRVNDAASDTTPFLIDASGNVGIGTATPGAKLNVIDDIVSDYAAEIFNDGNATTRWGLLVQSGLDDGTAAGPSTLVQFNDGDGGAIGSITFGSSVTNYNISSDIRLKENITDTSLGIDTLMGIHVRDYSWKADLSHQITHGFIAQELNAVYPQSVTVPINPDDIWQVDYSKLAPLIVKSIQDQQTQIEEAQSSLLSVNLKTDQNITTVAELQASVDTQLTVAGTELAALAAKDSEHDASFAHDDARLTALEALSDQIALDINAQASKTALLETQMQTLTEQLSTLTDFFTTFDLGNLVAKDALGNVDLTVDALGNPVLLGGTLKATVLETGALTIAVVDPLAPTIGTAEILPVVTDADNDGIDDETGADGKSVRVMTKAMIPMVKGSRIFTTFKNNPNGFSWIEKIKDDNDDYVGFKIRLSEAITAPVKVDWLLVEQKEAAQ